VGRTAVAIALPTDEREAVRAELRNAGFEPIDVVDVEEFENVLLSRRDVGVAILDPATDIDSGLQLYSLLHDAGRDIPALMIVSDETLDRVSAATASSAMNDEYVTRPYSTESLRWRVEAMCIRSQTVDDGSGPIIQTNPIQGDDWSRRATIVAVFNPKGGVGKTTIATNVAAALQIRKRQQVLLVDADTVTGHVTTSLGLDQVRTLADSWRDQAEGGPPETLVDIASEHSSGQKVVALTSSPLQTDKLEPERVADAITAARRGFDFVIIDLHPSYSPLNLALFDRSDRILVPVTPDVPAIRAAIQLRDVASELDLRDRLALVVNRANSGVSVADMERTVGMPSLALVRSGGLLFVRAANEGRTVIEMFPRERITADFDSLADRLLGTPQAAPVAAKIPFRLFSRQKEVVRA
jgi:pilus assembly protein CpaE